MEEWLLGMGAEVVGESWEELKYIRQAVNFLVLHAKQKKTLDDIQQNLCSALSVQQLYRISTMYWDDKFGTETVSPEVLQQMRGDIQVRSMQPMARPSPAAPCQSMRFHPHLLHIHSSSQSTPPLCST